MLATVPARTARHVIHRRSTRVADTLARPERVRTGGRHGRPVDKFTERARRVLTLAQEEAQRFNHNYIGTEHLLLGLVREGDGVAAKVLSNLGVELGKVRSAVEFIIGRGDRAVLGEIGLTPRAKKVIELAVDEARRLNHHYIGTEHLLLGLVREGEGIAAGVLESLGVNLERVRAETTRILSQSGPQTAGAGAGSGARQSTRTPTIDQLGFDLTAAARAGELDPVIGREKEIQRVVQILSRRTKNNPVLIGEPGVGKTAVVGGPRAADLQWRRARDAAGQAPADPRYRLARCGHQVSRRVRGADSRRLLKRSRAPATACYSSMSCTCSSAPAPPKARWTRPTSSSRHWPAASCRRSVRRRSTTTVSTSSATPRSNAASSRSSSKSRRSARRSRFCGGSKSATKSTTRLLITDEALVAAAEMSSRYISDRALPDKAIDLIDESASRVRIRRSYTPPSLKEANVGLEGIARRRNRRSTNSSTSTPPTFGTASSS